MTGYDIRDFISVGMSIGMELGNAKRRLTAYAEVFSIREPHTLVISSPLIGDIEYEPQLGKVYSIAFYRKEKGGISVNAEFKRTRILDAGRFYDLEFKDTPRLQQRRNYYRLPLFNDISVKFFRKDGDNLIDVGAGTLINISGGGISLNTAENLDGEICLLFEFAFEEQDFQLLGRVCRKERVKEGNYTGFEYGIEFIGLSEADKKSVIAAIHSAQVRTLKRK